MSSYIQHNYIEIIGALLGIIYMVLQYRANAWMWIVGIVMPIINLFVYFQTGIYAIFSLQIYYIFIASYGLWKWKFSNKRVSEGETSAKNLPITNTPRKLWSVIIGVLLALYGSIAFLLTFTDSNVVWVDSLNMALCIMGMWMCARKYVEQWWLWIVYDIICIGLYFYKELYFYSAISIVYAIIAVFGYLKWKKMMGAEVTD